MALHHAGDKQFYLNQQEHSSLTYTPTTGLFYQRRLI